MKDTTYGGEVLPDTRYTIGDMREAYEEGGGDRLKFDAWLGSYLRSNREKR